MYREPLSDAFGAAFLVNVGPEEPTRPPSCVEPRGNWRGSYCHLRPARQGRLAAASELKQDLSKGAAAAQRNAAPFFFAMSLLKPEWMPECRMDRIILHHTGGAHAASSLDKAHYHFLVEGNGNILRGDQPVSANAAPIRGEYAAHTARLNTGSIGVAVCAMLNATPRDGGRHPILPLQFALACEVAAELCRRYRIAVSPTTVLAHGEVDTNLGAYKTPGKWDPLFLPFLPMLTPRETGEHWRGQIREALRRQSEPVADEPVQAVQAAVMGIPMSAYLQDGAAWVPVRKAAEALGFAVLSYALPSGTKLGVAVVGKPGTEAATGVPLSAELEGGSLHVKARSLAAATGKQVSWDPSSRKVSIF